MTSWRLGYTVALEAWNSDRIADHLTQDATIRVAVHDAPMHGRDTARFLFGVLGEELAPPRIADEIIEGRKGVVLFETSIRGIAAQGLNVIDLDERGAVRELTVFFRPLEALQLIGEVVGARMAARFGPPAGGPPAGSGARDPGQAATFARDGAGVTASSPLRS